MRPPLAGKRAAARRLAGDLRRRLEPAERLLPVKLPGYEAQTGGAAAEPAKAAVAPEDAVARIDAARERLRATIAPPEDERDGAGEPPAT